MFILSLLVWIALWMIMVHFGGRFFNKVFDVNLNIAQYSIIICAANLFITFMEWICFKVIV
jgi:hypothetical protein